MYKCDQYPDLVLVKNSASGVLELVAQPVKTLVETVARGGTGCLKEKKVKTSVFQEISYFGPYQVNSSHLNVPVSVSQAVKTQLVRDLCCVHCIRQILLVSEDQQNLKNDVVKSRYVYHKLSLKEKEIIKSLTASLSSSSASILISSSRASPTLSLETTK